MPRALQSVSFRRRPRPLRVLSSPQGVVTYKWVGTHPETLGVRTNPFPRTRGLGPDGEEAIVEAGSCRRQWSREASRWQEWHSHWLGGTFWELPGRLGQRARNEVSAFQAAGIYFECFVRLQNHIGFGVHSNVKQSLSGTRCLPCRPQRTQGWPPALSFALTLWPCTSATRASECSVDQF